MSTVLERRCRQRDRSEDKTLADVPNVNMI